MTTTLQSIQLQGFRAYLARQEFDLRPGKSLAVFAPNAKGKSSLIDAVEVFFSETGSLERLGTRRSGTHAGPDALEHVHAERDKIVPSVRLEFKTPSGVEGDERKIIRPAVPRPKVATRILRDCKHDFIVRGHDLRRFVEARTPEERYKDVSGWFGLDPLVAAQKNLRTLRRKVTELLGDERMMSARKNDIAASTGGVVTSGSVEDLVRWINVAVLGVLDKSFVLGSLADSDAGYAQVQARAKDEADALGVTALDQLAEAIDAVWLEKDRSPAGYVEELRAAGVSLRAARATELRERTTAEKSVFAKVWANAQKLFANDDIPFDICPVCETPLSKTPHRSRKLIGERLDEHLQSLAAYNKAVSGLKGAEDAMLKAHGHLRTANKTLKSLLRAGKFTTELESLDPYLSAIDCWKLGDPLPKGDDAKDVLRRLGRIVSRRARQIRDRQREGTFAGAAAKIDELRRLSLALRLATTERDELLQISAALEGTAQRIEKELAGHVGILLHGLRDEINKVYSKIQGAGGGAPKIGLEPPDPDDRGQLRLDLVIDFSDNRKGVNPVGYLSDSQVHTMALSLRLAAIKLFNPSFPFIVLDDVVTSYDADHRKALASVIAEDFAGFQFILVTHDERFFRYLKEHLPSATWLFRQITGIEPEFGPKYIDHRITDQVIEGKLGKGEHAANEIRQAEEEWLLQKAREFGVNVRIRDIDKPYAYERSEIATAVASFLRDRKIITPVLPGFANPLWSSLQAGEVENFGSHFQDNPSAAGSVGDERTRWSEFKAFRRLFTCACGSTRFKRPRIGVERPLCAKCEMPFEFSASGGAMV